MSGLRFVDDIVGHLAWPFVVLVGILVFRQVLRIKIGDMTKADVTIGNSHFVFAFLARRKAKAELGYVGADLAPVQEGSTASSTSQIAVASGQESVASTEKVATREATGPHNMIRGLHTYSAEQSEQWTRIRAHLAISPHYAIHLAGLRIDAALTEIAGPDAPALGMLVRPKYLAEQGAISEELADASIRLLRIRNTVDGSPKFMLTHEIAEDFVNKAHELVTALGIPPSQ